MLIQFSDSLARLLHYIYSDAQQDKNQPPEKAQSQQTQQLLPSGTAYHINQQNFAFTEGVNPLYRPQHPSTSDESWPTSRLHPGPTYPPRNGFMPWAEAATGHFRPAVPPSYRNPPPPPQQSLKSGVGTKVQESAVTQQPPPHCPCCGEANWHHLVPTLQFQPYFGYMTTSGALGQQPQQHIKDCPRSHASAVPTTNYHQAMEHFQFAPPGGRQFTAAASVTSGPSGIMLNPTASKSAFFQRPAQQQPQFAAAERPGGDTTVYADVLGGAAATAWCAAAAAAAATGQQFVAMRPALQQRMSLRRQNSLDNGLRHSAYSDGEADQVSRGVHGDSPGAHTDTERARRSRHSYRR